MNRTLLAVVAVLIAALVVSRLARSGADRPEASSAAPAPAPTVTAAAQAPAGDPLAPARALLAENAGQTYLDSLLNSTDSLVRRWPDRGGQAFRVAIIEGGSPDYDPRMADFVREAINRWESAGLGYWYSWTADTSDADITFGWRKTFGLRNQAGQTDLSWDKAGNVLHASVVLATRNGEDSLFTDEALLDAAIHEVGHAMGMPHSADSADVMFPTTRTGTLTERDLATARLLYLLPPGPLKGPPPQ
ncbi:MAG TPA: matrixin family metalloprotease [Gemmatimonadales bacterium]|nr:matrixin family metalloprotease [Gemmatimonadales bacterium]